jgi:hypothetical protein
MVPYLLVGLKVHRISAVMMELFGRRSGVCGDGVEPIPRGPPNAKVKLRSR